MYVLGHGPRKGSSLLRTLHVIDSLGGGGAEHSLLELLPAMTARGVQPAVAVLGERAESDDGALRHAGIPVHRLPPGRVRRVAALRPLVRQHDVVHTTLFEADVAGRLAAWGTGVPVVTSLVNTSYDRRRMADPNVTPWKLAAARAVEGWTARRLTARFHAITQAVADAAVEALGIESDRITVVPRGRDPEQLGEPSPQRRAAARARLGLDPEAPVVVTVGRQEFQKGQEVLAAATARLPGVVTVFVGRPGAATAVIEAAAHERCRFLGHRTDVPDVLAAADVFAFPSRYEGLGGAVLEAMALALPVVASDLPALREVVEPEVTGVLVPPDDADALAAAVERVLRLPGAMGAAGRDRFLGRYTLDAVVGPMIDVLAGTVAGRAHHARPGASGT